VDYTLRKQMLSDAKNLAPDEVWERRESGLPKLWLIWKTLAVRRRCPAIFASGGYEPLTVSGARAKHVLAFSRGNDAVTLVQRLSRAINGDWADTAVRMPPGHWINALTNSPVISTAMKDLTARVPVALLLREDL
jgi:(1->4)-alpha-D-glucan 1-alpha-D-glucosylmutase